MDSLPKAPWRRRSVEHTSKEMKAEPVAPPQAMGDSVPRKVDRKRSDEGRRFSSIIRKPNRLPSPNNSQSTRSSGRRKNRSKSLFSLRRKKSHMTAHSIGADTGKAVNGHDHYHDHHDQHPQCEHQQQRHRGRRRGHRGVRHLLLGHRGASSGELGASATECMTDRDLNDVDFIIDNLPADLAAKMDLGDDTDHQSVGSHKSNGSRSLKDRRRSLHLQHIFGGSSRFKLLGHSSRSGNSSLMSSLSTAFSSMRSGIFVFTTTASDRRLAEQEGNALPEFIGDDQHGKQWDAAASLDYGEQPPEARPEDDCPNQPPKMPSRRDSLSSYQSRSYQSYYSMSHSSSSHQYLTEGVPSPMGGGACRLGVDGVPRRPGRRHSIGTPIEAIAEVENEVDLSSHHFSVAGTEATNKPSPFRRSGTLESISLFGVSEFAEEEEKEEDENAGLNRSAPTHKVGLSDEFAEELSQRERCRRRSAPPRPLALASKSSGGLPRSDTLEKSEELPFPVRRESMTSHATGGSQSQQSLLSSAAGTSSRRWRRNSAKVPQSVSPDATVMEKKSFLRRSLHFPKQRFGIVLKSVVNTRTEQSSTPAQQSLAT